MKKNIAIDFGASRIKSVAFLNSGKILDKFESIGSNQYSNKKINPNFFYTSLIKHLKHYSKKYKFTKIITCSEMHGYAIYDQNKKKLSNYLSWRYTKKNSNSTISYLSKNYFQNLTGLKARDGLPIVNWLMKKNYKINNKYLCGIAEILCIKGGKYFGNLHSTYAQSTGFYQLNNKFFLNKEKFLNKIINTKKNLIGKIKFNNEEKYLYGGYGDLQAAFMGSNLKNKELLINMGTGSQIILMNNNNYNKFEKRNYFNDNLNCITHIPSGRSLNLISNKMDKIYKKKNYLWSFIKRISINDLKNCKKIIDLNFLKIRQIKISSMSKDDLRNFSTIILKSYCDQYINILNKSKIKKSNFDKIILSGGIPKKIPLIKDYLEYKSGITTKIDNSKVDETLIGLIRLMKFNL